MKDAELAEVVDSAEVEVEKGALSGCLHTISGARIERGESSDDEGEKITD